MLNIWLAWRYLTSNPRKFNLTSSLGIGGLALGVASLFVSMAVVSGYETTLKQNIIDITGHILVLKKRGESNQLDEIREDLSSQISEPFKMSPYVWLEGLMAHKGALTGVFLEGAHPKGLEEVLNVRQRVIEGEFEISSALDESSAMIGVGLAKRFDLKVGDTFRVVLPFATDLQAASFRRKIKAFKVAGILELGRHEYNQRYILTHMDVVKSLIENKDRITGVRLKIQNPDNADLYRQNINTQLGYPYSARSWRDQERNIFKAVQLEKYVIFIVIFIMVIAACFNIASTLYVSVFRRYPDISILMSMGFGRGQVLRLFAVQGLLIGFVGSMAGLLLGLLLCGAFYMLQTVFPIVPSETYRISFIHIDFRWYDILLIVGSSMLICFLATLAPAFRGSRLNPVEGLRYE